MCKKATSLLGRLFLIGLLTIPFSCQDDTEIPEATEPLDKSEEHLYSEVSIISLEEANLVAANIDASFMASEESDLSARTAHKGGKLRKVRNHRRVNDKKGNPAFYIYNYEGEGFSIISGDKQTLPVLAYSDDGAIPSSDEELPCGLQFWMSSLQEDIYALRTTGEKKITTEYEWEWEFMKHPEQSLENAKIDPPDEEPIRPPFTSTPLMKTTWGQGCGYNDYTAYCSSSSNCYHEVTGCVATAIAQVMRFHQKPSSYQWSSMPDRVTQTGESWQLAYLMYEVGQEVDMNWGCTSSGASTSKGERALESAFGYSNSTNYIDYNTSTAEKEIKARRPVIFRGRESDNDGGTGHAFVGHGYKWYYTQCCGYLSFWIDWGWNGASNGWFSGGGWRPGNRSYVHDKKMLIVHP
jgi:hypothetical protein